MPSALFISPKDSIILVGPVIVSQCRRRESGPVTHKEAYMEAWRMQQKQSGSEQRTNEMCAQMAYECDPARAFQTAVEKLSRLQLYDTWSRNVSEANDADLHVPGCLFPLASMREQGARIATTTLPPILSKSLRLQSVFMQNAHQWAMDSGQGAVLHVCGTAPNSHGWLDCSVIPSSVSDVLASFCKDKTIILVGYKDHTKDYILMSFLKRCVQPHHSTNVVMLSTEAMSPLSSVSPVPVLPVVLDPGSAFETALKDGSKIMALLKRSQAERSPGTHTQSHINFLYKEDGNGRSVHDQLQRCLEIMLPGATLEKMPSSLAGTNWLVQAVPPNFLSSLWDGIVNKRCLDVDCSLLIVFLDGGPLVEVHGSILPILNNKVVPGGSVSLGLSGGHQHLRNGGALSSPAKKLEGMWGDPHSRQAASIAIGGSGVPVLVNHASVAGMVGLSSPVATEVPIEMIDRDRSIALAQLTQGANSSAAIPHQLSWAQLGSAQQGGQVFLMPNPSQQTAAANSNSRPPIRRSSAIDTDDGKTGGADSPNQVAGRINVDLAVGPFVAGDSVKVGESSGTSVGQIKLIHKYMERKKPLRSSSGSQKSQERSFEDSPVSPHSSSCPSSPQKPSSAASPQGSGGMKPNSHSTSSSPTSTTQPQPAPQAPTSSMLPTMPAVTGVANKAAHTATKPHSTNPGMVLVQTPAGIIQAPAGMAAGLIPNPAGLVQTSGGLAPTHAGLSVTSAGVVQPHTGLVQTSTGLVQPPAGLVAGPHGQGASLVYAPGIQGPVLVAHPYQYQQWMQSMAPYMSLSLASGAPGLTPGMPSPIHPGAKVAERPQQAAHPAAVSGSASSSQRSPELISSGMKRRSSRLSSSLPDIKVANDLLLSEEKKPKMTDGRIEDNSRPPMLSRPGDRSPRMIHSSSVPVPEYSGPQVQPSHLNVPIKQVSEDTELADITGGPVYLLPSTGQGEGKLPPFPVGRGVVQLWQFLLDLLLSPGNCQMVHWTGDQYEFRILQPDEIARLWGKQKNKPQMNYDKLSRGLRYYYAKGIMDKVPGKKLTFRFTCDVEEYVRSKSKNPNAVEVLRSLIKQSSIYAQQLH